MVRLLLIRHAATEVSDRGFLLGSTDVAATSEGLEKVERLLPLLSRHEPEQWYCSPLRRVVQTAERLKEFYPLSLPLEKDDRLREIDFGRWEQKSFADIERSDPDLIPAWSRYDEFIFPEGEPVAGFTGRVGSFLEEMKKKENVEVGVITHGGVIRTMICLALGMSARNYLLFSVNPASLTVIDLYPEGGVLTGLNL